MKLLPFLLLSTFVVSCSNYQLTDAGRDVKIKEKMKVDKCETVGKVVGTHKDGAVELARNSARNQAGKMGADSVVFEEVVANGKERVVHGMAYRCQK